MHNIFTLNTERKDASSLGHYQEKIGGANGQLMVSCYVCPSPHTVHWPGAICVYRVHDGTINPLTTVSVNAGNREK